MIAKRKVKSSITFYLILKRILYGSNYIILVDRGGSL